MKIFNSIKWRLQLWYGLILLVVLAGFGFTAYQLERNRQFRRVDDELRRRTGMLARVAFQPMRGRGPERLPFDGPPNGQPRPPFDGGEPERSQPFPREFHLPPQAANLFDDTDPKGFYYILWRRDGNELARSTNAPASSHAVIKSKPTTQLAQRPPAPGSPIEPQAPRMNGEFREVQLDMPPGEMILVGCSIAPELKELRLVALTLTAVGGVILLFGFAGGWWLAGRAIRPIDDITAAAAKISAGDLAQRINTADTESELGQLAAVLNSTFARLETTFAQQKQFTSDAAHELRTPVSVILTQTQGTLNKERPAAEYRETLEACQRAAQRMRRLIGSLLELARLDAGQDSLKREPVDLVRLTNDGVELVRPLAEDRRITIKTDLAAATALGNGDQLALAVTNLLTNAIHHNDAGGEVTIATRAENDAVILTVSDNGPGVAEEHLPHLFERFYRADAARSAHTGGAGLGLAIVKSCMEACGGTVACRNLQPKGFQVEIRLGSN
jgi:heavy metal sensor kinase